MKVLQISINQAPNIGGLETHLLDLTMAVIRRGFNMFTFSYQPLSTKTDWKLFEKKRDLIILRLPWIQGFFERLVRRPFLEFIYIFPGLFVITPFVLLFFSPNIIHAHGLIPAAVAVFWGKLFNRRVIVSLHSIYSFPNSGLYRDFVKFVLRNCDYILSLSEKSYDEVIALGINKEKVEVFTYWINLEKFKKIPEAKEKMNFKRFTVLFVGRLVAEKGVSELLRSVKSWDKNIDLVIAGSGPLENEVLKSIQNQQNVHFLGLINQKDLPLFYSAADLVIIPSVSEEGFGRVIIESLACSTPVLASNRGAIPEALDETVGKLIDITPENIKKWVEYFYHNPRRLKDLAKNARRFAERKYSEKNAEKIFNTYSS